MIIIDGVHFDSYKVRKVEMDLETCVVIFLCEFYGDNKIRTKQFVMKTNCDVNINDYIIQIDKIIHDGTNLS